MSPPELMCSLNRHSLFIVIALIAIPGAAPWSAGDSQAQDAALRRVAFVAMNVDAQSDLASAFRQGLRDAGYAEGRDIYIDWWNGGGDYDHVSEAVADAVRRKADVIVTAGTAVALAAKRQTSKIPIVMALVADPLGSGLVASLARPGGNVTGLSAMVVELSSKRLQLLKEAIPSMARVGIIFNPEAPYNGKVIELFKRAAPELGLTLMFVGIRSAKEFPPAFAELRRSKVDALMVLDDAFMATNEETILSMASKARLPVVLGYTPRSSQGTVISYSPDRRDLFRRAAGYGDKILKGASAADLPIEQLTRFELVVNLRTAKALGLKIPDSLLVQATEVIK